MNRKFSLFQSHLDLAHKIWSQIVHSRCVVIDATCGNGHDANVLASLKPLKLYCLDIQDKALEATAKKLEGCSCEAVLLKQCHSTFPAEIQSGSVSLIVYNLGYLPGSDKSVTTRVQTTLDSLTQAIDLMRPGGVISITCYPGHDEGAREEQALIEWGRKLDPKDWCLSVHQFENRHKSPSVLFIQKNTLSE